MIEEPLIEVPCPVCSSQVFQVIFRAQEVRAHLAYLRRFHRRRLNGDSSAALADRAEFTQDYATDIVACDACGLVLRNPRPPAEAIEAAYIHDCYGSPRLEALFQAQLELYRRKIPHLERWLRPPGSRRTARIRVLEVGSFVGGFLAATREAGWESLGVDPGEEVDAFCRTRGLPVFPGTLASLQPEDLPPGWEPGGVDCVAIWNTFDQLPQPGATLAAARRLLRPGGVLALRVPDGDYFRWTAAGIRRPARPLGGLLRRLLAWNNLLGFPYLHGYSARTLDRLLSPHGMQRLSVRADTLCRLADEQTRLWARWEERGVKLLCRIAAGLLSVPCPGRRPAAPWLDAYYRLPA
jgi:SAM-dependent methyltransferase